MLLPRSQKKIKGGVFTPGMTTTLRAGVCVFVLFLVLGSIATLVVIYHFLIRPTFGTASLPK